jgi:hypothetical protein
MAAQSHVCRKSPVLLVLFGTFVHLAVHLDERRALKTKGAPSGTDGAPSSNKMQI